MLSFPLKELGVYAPDEMGAVDRRAAQQVSVATLMNNAGRAVARAMRATMKPARVLVLCGPGNNGGDGYAAACFLLEAGWPVAVAALAEPKAGSAAAEVAARFVGPRVPFAAAEAARVDVVVDAVFGAGLARDVAEPVADVLRAARRVVAVDVPSGVDGGTGQVRGYAPSAELTVTFCRYKPAHLLYPVREMMGRIVLADIGMPPEALDAQPPQTWLNAPGLWRVPELTPESHKYTRGVVSLCAGETMPGAARLCASGARAAGAGLVRLAAGKNAPAFRLGDPGMIVDDGPLEVLLEDVRRHVWVCGPGLTEEEVTGTLLRLVEAGRCVLADAGALSAAAGQPDALRGVAVMTPHIGEFTGVFGAVGDDAPARVRQAARQTGAVVVLKGASTLIAAPDGRLAINIHATPALGTAGSGDTLSGVIAAMLAAGMPAWEAACAGVWLHGEAGLHAGPWPVAEDLDRHLGAARAEATRRQRLSGREQGVI
ncbi:NAD(P)H-hydrate dehydratase [Acetobacter peroxydans]|uniref:Bifunctional NAD(P)H-hydrate repair enzyme n=1 Tax=Acetobacter peroxydans TaxID=104098 RepID=A0A4Y3TTV9_9PROT|nr:NAD(P)H-hydrate dehydratase [Acetobacter peroxydans]GBR32776.1 sugar kinase [Acetobacter peroxydans NBRC 13755]GBR44712.1 sugar kinase [Acetobacter peroxydans]GEB84909.1 bifunctional NAD(P)H-hydrate repair enzyme [Acetobacter peroxydans]